MKLLAVRGIMKLFTVYGIYGLLEIDDKIIHAESKEQARKIYKEKYAHEGLKEILVWA